MPPAGSFLSSSSMEHRVPMDFTDKWGEGAIFAWYRKLQKSSVTVSRLQIRIDNGKPPHRFVLAYLQDGTVCRFDRRPETAKPSTIILQALGGAPTSRAADDYCTLQKGDLEQMESLTQCEIDMNTPPNTDLLLVLSVCFALAQDTKTRDYALLKYNCYFFSWTIIMVVSRHTLPFVVPAPDDVSERLRPAIDDLTSSFTGTIVDLLLSVVLTTITGFRDELGQSLQSGMYKHERLLWMMPMGVIKFVLRQTLKIQLYFGLEENLKKQTRGQLQKSLESLLGDILKKPNMGEEHVDKHLWINELMEDFRPLIREHMEKLIWDAILNIISSGRDGSETQKDSHNTQSYTSRRSRLKSRLFGDAQFIRLWNAALDAALPAARDAAYAKSQSSQFSSSKQLHIEIFNTAGMAGCTAALEAARRVVNETKAALNNPKRDKMWENVWGVWEKVWKTSNAKAQDMVAEMVERMVDGIVALVTKHVVAAVGENQSQIFQASVIDQKSQKRHNKVLSVNDFQTNIIQFVRSSYIHRSDHGIVVDIQAAMTRAWDASRQSYKPLI